MTFVSKGMAQNSGKSHLCNVKYGKLYDGEQQVLVFLKVLWYANKCIRTDFRIHLFSGEKKYFCIKRDGSKFGKIAICNVKYGKLYDGEQHLLAFVKVLWYTNKCIVTDFRIHHFSGEKNDFCIKRNGSKFWKIAHLQCKIWQALRWRATGAGVSESTLVCQQVYHGRFSNSSFLWSKK